MREGKGTGNRFANDLSGNHLDRLRSESTGLGVFLAYGKRYCETCKSHKPKGKEKAFKGWKCNDCKLKIRKAA